MNDERTRIRVGRVNLSVGQHVLIGKEKMLFENGSENNYNDEIFKIIMVIRRTPAPSTSRRI